MRRCCRTHRCRPWPRDCKRHWSMATWPLTVWPRQRWRFLWRCAGVLARIALALLPVSSCPRCWRCAGIVAKFAFEGPADAALAFAGVALASLPLSRWCHCQHCAVISAASIAPALSPFLPSLRAPRRGVRPSAVIALCGVLAVSGVVNVHPLFLLPGALAAMYAPFCDDVIVGASHSSCRCLLVAGIALVSLPSWPSEVRPMQRWRLLALRWRPRPHRVEVIASVALSSSLLALHRRCCSLCPHRAPLRRRSLFCCHHRTWRPCRILRRRRPASVFCCLMPLRQSTRL